MIMDLLNDSSIWLVFSFLIFLFILFKFGKNAFIGLLDARITTIQNEIQTAEALRVEAQEMLAQYQRKHRDAIAEAEGIISNAEQHASEIRKTAEKDLSETLSRREAQLRERMKTMEAQAIAEIRAHAASLSISATAQIIDEKLDTGSAKKLVEESIARTAKNIH